MYDPHAPKTDEEFAQEQALIETVRDLAYRLKHAREDSAEQKLILRMLEGIRHGSELGGLLMEEVDASGTVWG